MIPDYSRKKAKGNNNRPSNRDNNSNFKHKNNRNGNGCGNKPRPPEMATAPYNFVSLPKKMMVAPMADAIDEATWHKMSDKEKQNTFKDYVMKNGKNDGYIELSIVAETPFFIAGEKRDGVTEFFSRGAGPVIPGSSVRGMTKNLLKIISCGAMRSGEDIDDRRLYFRSVGGKRGDILRANYERLIGTNSDGTKPGFLIRDTSGNSFICPADEDAIKTQATELLDGPKVIWDDEGKSAKCVTGYFDDKCHYYVIGNGRWNERIPMADKQRIVESYENDTQRRYGKDRKWNLLSEGVAKTDRAAAEFTGQSDINLVVPCYYREKNRHVMSFGHGPRYRVPYDHTIAYRVPSALKGELPDFADAIFGKKELWGSRVFFDDAPLTSEPKYEGAWLTHPLMTPNPTSYQLYLEQPSYGPAKNHWDSEGAKIRGYKFFWHTVGGGQRCDWKKSQYDKGIAGAPKIKPLSAGATFTGRIRFRDLSDIELGALCSVFSIVRSGRETRYKMGMGKPLGMGTLKVTATLHLDDSDAIYSRLFNDDGSWVSGDSEAGDEKMIDFMKEFEDYRTKALGNYAREFESTVLYDLVEMMDVRNADQPHWKEKTSMMKIGNREHPDNRFKNRVVLKPIQEFLKEKFK